MNRLMKKATAVLLAVIMIFGMAIMAVPEDGIHVGMVASAANIVASGECGDNVTWTLDSEGTLTMLKKR